jgi:hypothetical protein
MAMAELQEFRCLTPGCVPWIGVLIVCDLAPEEAFVRWAILK